MLGHLEFTKEFVKIAKWRAHYADMREETNVVGIRVAGELCLSATNRGELKIWNMNGKLLGSLSDVAHQSWNPAHILANLAKDKNEETDDNF